MVHISGLESIYSLLASILVLLVMMEGVVRMLGGKGFLQGFVKKILDSGFKLLGTIVEGLFAGVGTLFRAIGRGLVRLFQKP